MKNSQSGFTLIELLVVISIVSLISSIIFSASYSARAKAVSSQIQSQTQQVQKSIVLLNETTQTGYVDPGNTTSYYCVGKTAGQTCKFWGETLTGNAALKAATDQYMPAFNVPMVRVDGLEYQGIVYKCAERNSTGCTGAALYWAQSNESTCKAGKVVVTGVGGVICGKNADGVRDNYVETATEEDPWNVAVDRCPSEYTYTVISSLPQSGYEQYECKTPGQTQIAVTPACAQAPGPRGGSQLTLLTSSNPAVTYGWQCTLTWTPQAQP